MTALDAQLTAWLAPISAQAPTGSDVREQPVHEQMRAEIAKIGRADGGDVAWDAVLAAADALLRAHAKDLLVASWLARALDVFHGVQGLRAGMELLAGLLVRYGDALFPRRLRARGAALAWYVEQTAASLDARSADGKIDLRGLAAPLAALETAVEQALGSEAPSLSVLSRRVASAVRVTSAAPTLPGETAEPAAATARLERSETVTSAHDAPPPVLLAQSKRLLLQVARAQFAADPADARSYRLRRLAAGLGLDALPASDGRGRSELDPPAPGACGRLHAALHGEHWEAALSASEALIERCPLWLEGHLLSARALTQLGPRFASACGVVLAEARALSARLPGLDVLRFADGTPVASEDARAWLRGESEAPAPVRAVAPELPVVDADLLARVVRGEAPACAEFEAKQRCAPSACAAFDLRRELAGAFERAGNTALAGVLYRGLVRDAAVYRLARWDPDRAVAVLAALRRTGPHPKAAQEAAQLSLARLAPTALL